MLACPRCLLYCRLCERVFSIVRACFFDCASVFFDCASVLFRLCERVFSIVRACFFDCEIFFCCFIILCDPFKQTTGAGQYIYIHVTARYIKGQGFR